VRGNFDGQRERKSHNGGLLGTGYGSNGYSIGVGFAFGRHRWLRDIILHEAPHKATGYEKVNGSNPMGVVYPATPRTQGAC
jgi:hypothetical protein